MLVPTPFADLNAVLDVLRRGVEDRLGSNLVGIYLQGSFAVGDADANSDCDFIVAIRRDLTPDDIADLDRLHEAIHDLPYRPWRHRLEGSYVPAAILRRWSETPRDPPGEPPRPDDWADPGLSGRRPHVYPFVYLDHGARTLARSEHDNSQVVRWSLRERGITLTGPDPRTLIDPVPPEALRTEIRALMATIAATDLQPIDTVFWQSFWVGLCCRSLHTIASGTVQSKKAACLWAVAALAPLWRETIERAREVRDGDRAAAMAAASAADIERTRAFVRYAADLADRSVPTDATASARLGAAT